MGSYQSVPSMASAIAYVRFSSLLQVQGGQVSGQLHAAAFPTGLLPAAALPVIDLGPHAVLSLGVLGFGA
ncbi:hypothetical protein ABBQ32_013220 [Trebouxia sp. C0010 RCD-2024]